jgi:hypothetical protein
VVCYQRYFDLTSVTTQESLLPELK